MATKTNPVTIGWTRYSGTRRGFTVQIEDPISGCLLMEIDLPADQFGSLAAGHGSRGLGEATVYPMDRLGMKREVKAELLDEVKYNATDAEVRAAVAVHEVDGWEGNDSDLKNHNRSNGKGQRAVWYARWVPSTEEHRDERMSLAKELTRI